MKIGLIGCGGIGDTHNKALKALSLDHDITVVALADCREDFLKKAKELWPEAEEYTQGMDLIDHARVDSVHICLPSYLHTQHAVKAMEKGLDVLIEKPVCITEEDCKILLEAKARTGAKVMIGHVLRFFEEYIYLKEVFDSNTYGQLKAIEMGRKGGDVLWGYQDWFHDAKKSGSVMLDLHVHDVDFLHYLLGKPDTLEVEVERRDNGLVHHVSTKFQFGLIPALAEGLWDLSPSRPFEAYFKASFEKGMLIFDSNATSSLVFNRTEGDVVPIILPHEYAHTGTTDINIANIGPYYSEIKYFVECLLENKPIEQATLEDGIEAVRLVFQEQRIIGE